MMKKIKKNFTKILVFSLIAVSAVAYWYWQRNVYSKDILSLEILGPASVDFAENFDYTVKYKNNGKVRLEEAKLIFEYPKNAILEEGKNYRQEISIDDIYPGEEKTYSFPARLIGQDSEVLMAKATINYKPKNLKQHSERVTTFSTQIKSLPLTFEFDLSSKVEPAKNLKFRLNYFSNIDYPLMDLRVIAEYPSNFEFVSSNPKSLEKIEWELPPLNRAEGGRVEITGIIQGEVGDQKLFKAKLGMWRDGEFILLKEIAKGVEITQPGIFVTQKINGNYDYVANPGELLHYEIFFKNIGKDTLTNLSLVNTLDGEMFDLQSINAPEGDSTSGDNSIVWDWRSLSSLQFLESQEENKVDFWVKLKPDFQIPSITGNLVVKNKIYISPATEEFSTKINSKLGLVQKAFFQDEIFGNSGPISPIAGETTTYTIIWQVKNYYNEVKNVKVKTTLPEYVHLTGKIFPEDSRLTYDSQSREIVWEVGDLKVGQGVLNIPPNVAFQVSFSPTISQIGQSPEIVTQSKISGEDSWTGDTIEQTAFGVNTNLPDDPSINGQGTVR
jgi:uncharacterized repeat protein (TIGR01451 family)